LVVSGGIVPTAACSEPTALVAPSLSEVAQSPPTPYFTNVTDEVGLTGVTGFRVSIADVNGDDYPDLILHKFPSRYLKTATPARISFSTLMTGVGGS
jgi:hypothetical protein